jgi:hypothetical protein
MPEGVRFGLVYLELQNLAPGETLYVYYNAGRLPLHCELKDSKGNLVDPSLGAVSQFFPQSCWLALPSDSSLRFRTGSSGSGPDYPCLFIISDFIAGKWAIPFNATNDYYLSGTFSSISPTNDTRPHVWDGTLNLPPVKISMKSLTAR